MDVHNNTFYGNTADGEGGGIYLYFYGGSPAYRYYNNIHYHDSEPSISGDGAPGFTASYCLVNMAQELTGSERAVLIQILFCKQLFWEFPSFMDIIPRTRFFQITLYRHRQPDIIA
jgi:hypothetical protein